MMNTNVSSRLEMNGHFKPKRFHWLYQKIELPSLSLGQTKLICVQLTPVRDLFVAILLFPFVKT